MTDLCAGVAHLQDFASSLSASFSRMPLLYIRLSQKWPDGPRWGLGPGHLRPQKQKTRERASPSSQLLALSYLFPHAMWCLYPDPISRNYRASENPQGTKNLDHPRYRQDFPTNRQNKCIAEPGQRHLPGCRHWLGGLSLTRDVFYSCKCRQLAILIEKKAASYDLIVDSGNASAYMLHVHRPGLRDPLTPCRRDARGRPVPDMLCSSRPQLPPILAHWTNRTWICQLSQMTVISCVLTCRLAWLYALEMALDLLR